LEYARQRTLCEFEEHHTTTTLLNAFADFRLQYANAYVLHEYAHGEVALRLGATGVRVGPGEKGNIEDASYLLNLTRMAFDPRQIANIARRGVNVTGSPVRETYAQKTQESAAGLNLHSYFASQHFASMLNGDTSPSRAMGYAVNKLFSPVYFQLDQTIGDDPSSYVADLQRQGIQTTKNAIQQYQLLAAVLSNGMWTSARALTHYGELRSNTPTMSWTLDGGGDAQKSRVYWPEFQTYLNQRGVSFGGDLSFETSAGSLWTLGMERNTIGQNQGTDLSLGFRQQFANTSLSSRITHNQNHLFGTIRVDQRLSQHLGLTGLIYAVKGDTLAGQRLAFGSKSGGYVGLMVYF